MNKSREENADKIYHIGASLKDLGEKWFWFSKMEKKSFEMMGRVKYE